MVERASPLWRPRHRQSVERTGLAHSLRHGDIVPISQEGAELTATMTTTASRPTLMGTATDDPLSLLAKEWLVTNGIGGYASSSLLGVATRRYHGLFVPDLPGRGRTLLIPRLDETVDQGTGMALLSDRKSTRLNSSHSQIS